MRKTSNNNPSGALAEPIELRLEHEAGWDVPNPFGKPEAELRRITAKLQDVVKAKGHDANRGVAGRLGPGRHWS